MRKRTVWLLLFLLFFIGRLTLKIFFTPLFQNEFLWYLCKVLFAILGMLIPAGFILYTSLKEKKCVLPFLLLLCYAALFLPWNNWYEQSRFEALRPEMEAVATSLLAEGFDGKSLAISQKRTILLPSSRLSRNGKVELVYTQGETSALYYVSFCKIEVLDGASAYLYFENPPLPETLIGQGDGCVTAEAMDEHWIYCGFDF